MLHMAEMPFYESPIPEEVWPRRIFFDDVTREVFVPAFLASSLYEDEADEGDTIEVAIQMVEDDDRSVVVIHEGHHYLPLSFLEVHFKESVAAEVASNLRRSIEQHFNLPPLRSH